MRDTELYRYLLGVEEPWTVSRVDLDVRGQRVDIWINHKEGVRWPCPQCSSELGLYDHAEERVWRHLDSCQFLTYLHARIPRVDCSEHGVLQVKVPWAEPRSQFTLLFERLALDLLKECDIQGATDILRISWDEAWHILERAVKRGLQRKGEGVVAHIGIDEKAAAKGHKYLTLVCDLKASTVEYIGDGRKQESLDAYYGGLSESQREGIEAVAMDMWEAYIESTLDHVPGAEDKIVFDRFHILSHMAEAVDTVRKQEHQLLKKQGDETLKGTKYLWLYGQENIPLRRKAP
ncbi:ISL3 family transposase [Candidatus Hakubella thermalkaliphila]|uniref:Transposase n=1 Tax=Candidatus Hakubella thermalkaliphila TaxID=2754717 RepID=A0A6V8PG63_9ACTN|nr:ISL3 family transposase [Candidatus Hakubella thermalkaliphila]GFP30684.1 hypothetical protein HKBW3S34_01604 [Candidatus Hakubella thermalkaliphila]